MNQLPQRRNLWPFAIIAYLAVFATFLVIYVIWALGQKQDLVAENYYEQEIRYQEQLDRLQRTQAQIARTTIIFVAAQNCIVVTLPAEQAQAAKGRIQLYRPANARLDREIPLAVNARGIQTLDASALAAGLWKVRVEWSVGGEEYFFDQTVIVTGAPTSGSTGSMSDLSPPDRKPALL